MSARPAWLPVSVLLLAAGCGRPPLRDINAAGGTGPSAGAGGSGGSAGVAGATSGAGTTGGSGAGGGAGSAACGRGAAAAGGRGVGLAQCADGIDNDHDGSIDYDDPECIGGGDNDESSFAFGIPDDTEDCVQDCFFDGNSGAGDDGCRWQLKCDPLSTMPSCPFDAIYFMQHVQDACSLSASQTQTCVDRCSRLVPNGCDCFGCCVVPGAPTPILLATTCTAADFGNPVKCPPCTQVTQCLNPCDRCEFCIGKRVLPDDCTRSDGCAPYGCPSGSVACGVHGVASWACPAGTSCVTGCCLPLVLVP
jgi:hypothetical protein